MYHFAKPKKVKFKPIHLFRNSQVQVWFHSPASASFCECRKIS